MVLAPPEKNQEQSEMVREHGDNRQADKTKTRKGEKEPVENEISQIFF